MSAQETIDTTTSSEKYDKFLDRMAEKDTYFEMIKQIKSIGHPVPPPGEFDIEDYYAAGVVRKSDLKDGSYYIGLCRNSHIAVWDAKNDCFWYIRFKFDSRFIEKINHIESDDTFDTFIPFYRIPFKSWHDDIKEKIEKEKV